MKSSKFIEITLKTVRIFWIAILIGVIGIIALLGYFFNEIEKDNDFGSFKIPNRLSHLKKPLERFSKSQVDSLKSISPTSEKLIITGTGYYGYDFYYWHKKENKGEIYIRGFESEREI